MSANIGAVPITTGHVPEPSAPGDNYLTHGRGFMSWAFTLDHKRIGLLYMMFVVSAFALGGIFAVILRTMLWSPALTTAAQSVVAISPGGGWEPWSLQVVEMSGDRISGITFFLDTQRFFPMFGLPARLDT